MANLIVGISDIKVGKAPDVIVTFALGSCVGICLYDKSHRIAGMSHIMLPSSIEFGDGANILKFANTALPELVSQMVRAGATERGLVAKIAGGAKMFAVESSSMNIGDRNVAAVRKQLLELRIPVISHDVGENYGRTVYFYPETGVMEVKSAAQGVRSF